MKRSFNRSCFPINPADILLVEGKYANKPKLPSLMGAECIAKVKKLARILESLNWEI